MRPSGARAKRRQHAPRAIEAPLGGLVNWIRSRLAQPEALLASARRSGREAGATGSEARPSHAPTQSSTHPLVQPRERFRKHRAKGPCEWAGLGLFEGRSKR